MRGTRRSGRTVPLDVSFGECLEGGSRVIAGIILDITERLATQEMLDRQAEDLRRSEEALRYQTQLVNSIVASMADGVIAIDAAGDVVLYNPAAARLLGEPVESSVLLRDEIGDSPYRAFRPDQTTPIEWADLPLLRAVRGEVVDSVEMFVRPTHRPEGFWLNGAARPMIGNDGVLRGGVLVFRDITEQKASREALRQAKEEAEAANRAKSEFLSRMSHELRTPMNAILGFAQLLDNDELPLEHRDPVERILKAGRHLLTLINEVLDISRIEAGRLQIQIGPVQAYEVLQSALELMGPVAAQRQVELAPLSSRDAHWIVDADRQSLTQILVNLLANAVKYNRQHGSVRASFEVIAERRLRISIADTGRGLSPEQQRKLFVPFERLGAERTGVEGTGLGLAYSNHLANAMGASIGVNSELEIGSTFWIEMPLNTMGQTQESVRANFSTTSAMMANVDMGMTQILCIQDDPDSLHAIEEVVERLPGYALIPASTAAMGIHIAQTQGPELVLLDLDIPDMHGMEALRALRAGMGARQIPVVVLSGNITEELKKKVRDAGAHAFIGKPLQVMDLVDTVACLI